MTIGHYAGSVAGVFALVLLALGYGVSAYWNLFCLCRLEPDPVIDQQAVSDGAVSAEARR